MNHHYTKSKTEYKKTKLQRGYACKDKNPYDMKDFDLLRGIALQILAQLKELAKVKFDWRGYVELDCFLELLKIRE